MSADDPAAPPASLISLADYERAAGSVIDPAALGYFAGGAGDEITLRDNVLAWRRLAIRPRVLVGVGECDCSVTVLGCARPHTLIIAPMAYQGLAHPDAEIGTAVAAGKTGTIMCVPTFATAAHAAIAEAAPAAPRWFQLYVFPDRGVTRELIAQAVEHGYEALVVTVDLPVVGVRERELRAQATVQSKAGELVTQQPSAAMTPAELAASVDPDLRWSDIEQFAADFPLPVLVKGILTPEDARLAAEHGARGVVVSNHGGRQLDTVLSAVDALDPVLDAVGDRLEVLIDGGVRRGTDVLKALALGARAVIVGRPVLWGLALEGSAGVRRVLEDPARRVRARAGSGRLAAGRGPDPQLHHRRTVARRTTMNVLVTRMTRSFVTAAPWLAAQP